jgi:hypothetical protein
MRFLVRALVVLCVLAFVGGAGTRSAPPHRVPVSTVNPIFCNGDGHVVAVTESTDVPGVYHVRCADGSVAVAPHR